MSSLNLTHGLPLISDNLITMLRAFDFSPVNVELKSFVREVPTPKDAAVIPHVSHFPSILNQARTLESNLLLIHPLNLQCPLDIQCIGKHDPLRRHINS